MRILAALSISLLAANASGQSYTFSDYATNFHPGGITRDAARNIYATTRFEYYSDSENYSAANHHAGRVVRISPEHELVTIATSPATLDFTGWLASSDMSTATYLSPMPAATRS